MNLMERVPHPRRSEGAGLKSCQLHMPLAFG